ncbi:MAG: protein kinase, partial [Polyangiaceae bacterium]|nr:protein kinase [Polyangiaceae bacterium]
DALFCPKDGTPLGSSRTKPGDDPYLGLVIGDQIECRQLVGIGSMGRVYRAFQRGVERDVAVKMLHRELSANTTLVARFLREARIASHLSHPNLVQVVMAGQLPEQPGNGAIGGELYIVMEFLDGISLMSAVAAAGDAMPLPRSLHVVLQICDAVGEAHAQGIVHRDVKPENIMLVRRGNDADFVKVLDFGIARLDWGGESIATQAGLIFGTAKYISPEGSQGEKVGPPADVYAIATILYQCLSGHTPFDNDSPMALLLQHAYQEPPPLRSVPRASYVPAPLEATVMRNLAKNPADRAPDARAFGRELVQAARAGGLSPDDLVPRSTLLGQRAAQSSFASIQPTRQMHLSAQTAARIGAPGAATYFQTPAPGALQESSATTSPVVVDVADAPSTVLSQLASAPMTGTPLPRPSVTSVPPRAPSANHPTLDDDTLDNARRGRHDRMRVFVFVGACFLAGAGLAAFGAHRLGLLGPHAGDDRGTYVLRAQEALKQQRWAAPPSLNVKDITNEGLARYPRDRELLDVRARAAEELVGAALGRKYEHDLDGALQLAMLAHELAPDRLVARHLVNELRALLDQRDRSDTAVPVEASAPPVVSAPGRPPRREPSVQPVSPKSHQRKTPATANPPPPASASSPTADEPPPATNSTSGRWL